MALFGAKGYRATTVGEIERAAGLSPRAGAFYRHFASKEAVFQAALDRWIADVSAFPEELGGLLPLEDLRSELTVIARGSLRILARHLDLFRMLARDAVEFPAIVARVHDQLVNGGYRQMEEWFAERLEARGRATDTAALAAVALSALVHYREDEAVYGVPPAGVGEEDFVHAWVDDIHLSTVVLLTAGASATTGTLAGVGLVLGYSLGVLAHDRYGPNRRSCRPLPCSWIVVTSQPERGHHGERQNEGDRQERV